MHMPCKPYSGEKMYDFMQMAEMHSKNHPPGRNRLACPLQCVLMRCVQGDQRLSGRGA
jgi:hypothetical protein